MASRPLPASIYEAICEGVRSVRFALDQNPEIVKFRRKQDSYDPSAGLSFPLIRKEVLATHGGAACIEENEAFQLLKKDIEEQYCVKLHIALPVEDGPSKKTGDVWCLYILFNEVCTTN